MGVMRDVKVLAKRLRACANVLDALFEEDATPAKAEQIRQSLPMVRLPRKKRLHWTQKPENREKLVEKSRRAAQTRIAQRRAQQNQTPEAS